MALGVFCIDNVFFSETEDAIDRYDHQHQARHEYQGSFPGQHFCKEIIFCHDQNGEE